jgi:hypothetical protein
MTRIDRYSLAVVPIQQIFNEEVLDNATGLIWKPNERFYLVTNWHVTTCRRSPTLSVRPHRIEPPLTQDRYRSTAPSGDSFQLLHPPRIGRIY